MDDELRVRYPFFSMRYRRYIRVQAVIIGALLVAAAALFIEARHHPLWWLAHAWWICLVAAGLEVVETWLALRHAKRRNESAESADGDAS